MGLIGNPEIIFEIEKVVKDEPPLIKEIVEEVIERIKQNNNIIKSTYKEIFIQIKIYYWRCRGPESNQGHADFQSAALPTELPRQPI